MAATAGLAGTSPAVTAQYAATLTVSDTSVPAGSPVTVTLADGPGGPWTWLALAPTGSPDSAYVQWTYVGWQVTAKTWTVALPSAGSYEFRLFLDNGFTRIATSPTVTATP